MASMDWNAMLEIADEAGGFEALPEGEYDANVHGVEHKVSQNGKDMFVVDFVIANGPFAKRHIWSNIVLSPEKPAAMGFFFRNMASLGITRDDFAGNPSNEALVSMIIAKSGLMRLKVAQREWQGQTQNDVKSMKKIGESTAAPSVQPGVPSMPTPQAAPTPQVGGETPAPAPAATSAAAPPPPPF